MDARDILGIEGSASAAPRPRAPKPSIKKPEGMSREVFALLVQDAASAAAQGISLAPTPAVSEAFKERKTRVVGWEWRAFNNAARDDGLVLNHWSKLSDKSTTYTFSRFNKVCKILSYTDDEYDKHLTHPGWDKAQSDLLFDLCKRFDLRWPVIHDRFPEGRTIEQLKERYYDMCRLLLAARSANPADGTDYSEHALAKFKFDAKHERERKAEFERQYDRSEDEVRDEVRRLEQAKALEAKMRAQKKAAKPGGRAAGLAALRASLSANGLGGASVEQLALTGLPSLAGLMDAPKKHRNADVWLRSKDLSNKRPASDKLSAAFEDRMRSLHMPVRPLPTEVNVNLYNQCRVRRARRLAEPPAARRRPPSAAARRRPPHAACIRPPRTAFERLCARPSLSQAHVVLLVELESKLEKLEGERQFLLQRHQPPMPVPPAAHHGGHHAPVATGGGGGGQKRAMSQGGGSAKRSHH
jgi:DNA methyltransferase 1-associated protein 1